MEIKVGNRVIDKFNSISLSLKYDSVASAFSAQVYFDPYNSNDRQTYVPGKYSPATLTHNGETLLTGVLLSQGFADASVESLMKIGGYSKSGVIEDCQSNPQFVSNQFLENSSLAEIAQKICFPFGLDVIIDDVVKYDANIAFTLPQILDSDQTIKEFLSKLAAQKNIVLSHNTDGNIILTRADTKQKPIYNFIRSQPVLNMELIFDGQQLHDSIITLGQAIIGTSNNCDSSALNPYVQHSNNWKSNPLNSVIGTTNNVYGKRPKVSIQTSGDDNTTTLTARQLLSQELKSAIRLKIDIEGWELNGKIVRPNRIVTVMNPRIFLYQKTRWFIESVDFRKDERSETATLNLVLPECFNDEEVKNVFTGTNLTVEAPQEIESSLIIPEI